MECSYTKATPGCGGGRAGDEGEDGFIHRVTLDPALIAWSSYLNGGECAESG